MLLSHDGHRIKLRREKRSEIGSTNVEPIRECSDREALLVHEKLERTRQDSALLACEDVLYMSLLVQVHRAEHNAYGGVRMRGYGVVLVLVLVLVLVGLPPGTAAVSCKLLGKYAYARADDAGSAQHRWRRHVSLLLVQR
jgi:hypothetical protein